VEYLDARVAEARDRLELVEHAARGARELGLGNRARVLRADGDEIVVRFQVEDNATSAAELHLHARHLTLLLSMSPSGRARRPSMYNRSGPPDA
jgi:hypothetical protein